MQDQSRALLMARQAVSNLYDLVLPLGTNLWCVKKVKLQDMGMELPIFTAVNRARATEIESALNMYVETLSTRSVKAWVEADYAAKYATFRNYYIPESLRQQAEVSPWYLEGKTVPEEVYSYMVDWWTRYLPSNFHVATPEQIPCPRYEAAGGVCYVHDDTSARWEYLKKGPNWSYIQRGTSEWLDEIVKLVPNEWIGRPIPDLVNVRSPELESMAVETPVIRMEGGPGKVRWARNSSANVYILGRMYARGIQDDHRWSTSSAYIGKASNTVKLGCKSLEADGWLIGTHGDDWIAWCPECGRWHSGDWSNFDLHVAARTQAACKEAYRQTVGRGFSDREMKLFYALAYFAMKTPTFWLWLPDGKRAVTIQETLGHVRSGSGEFILDNNCENSSVLNYLLRTAHEILRKQGKRFPCRSRSWWPTLSKLAADFFGWVLKPTSQFSHPNGFVACRCIHEKERAFLPVPCISSVVRNWVNPSYDPNEYPQNTLAMMQNRFRDVVKTLAWNEDAKMPIMRFENDSGHYNIIEGLAVVAMRAGVEDPWGVERTQADLSREIGRMCQKYSTDAYLSS